MSTGLGAVEALLRSEQGSEIPVVTAAISPAISDVGMKVKDRLASLTRSAEDPEQSIPGYYLG